MSFRLAFSADIVPTATNEALFVQGDVERLFGNEILQYLSSVDFRCYNLETPLTDSNEIALYPGPHLKAKPATINAIKKINPSLLTLGNNHALDYGEQGLMDTIAALNRVGIEYTGAGANYTEAVRPYIFNLNGYSVGLFNCSEYEFAAATNSTYGVNPYDPLASFDLVRKLKEKCAVVIVLYHGGKEFYRYPSPQLQRVCRKFVDCGANLVICQHTHCIGCEEEYSGSTIVYGQGNFLFDRKENEYKKTGMFVECGLDEQANVTISYVPLIKQKECVRLANDLESKKILDDFYARSEQIKEPGFVASEYRKLASEEYKNYILKILRNAKILRLLNKLTDGKFVDRFYSPKEALAILNIISPENHAELFKTGLRMKGKMRH